MSLPLLAFLMPASSGWAWAQLGVDSLTASSRISVLTILPGDEIYSMFGHTAIRVQDPAQGIDHTYNYGTFSFGNPIVFAGRFAYGRLDYVLSDAYFPRMLEFYRDVARRPVIEQMLNLTQPERQRIFDFLEWNARPENRTYRYDFLYDNCSTRVRDVFYDHLPALQFSTDTTPDETFRHLLDPYAADRRFLDFGWDLLMGTPVDRRAAPWETMFLPLELMDELERATITRGGNSRPFVARKDTLFWIEGRGMPDASPPWPSILTWGWFLAGLAITLAQSTGAAARATRWFDALLLGVVGMAGTLMLFMWAVSLHSATENNLNLMWAWPTHLIAAVWVARRSHRAWQRHYFLAVVILATTALLGWTLWPQEFHAAAIPVVLLLALRAAWHVFGTGVLRVRKAPAEAS